MPASDAELIVKARLLEKEFLKETAIAARKAEKLLALPLGKMSKSASEFDKSLAAANARVIAFGASAGIIFGVQRAFAELVKSTIEVEAKLTDINVLMNQNSEALERFGKSLFTIAKDTGRTFGVVAGAAAELARQGLSAEDTLKRTRDAMVLARLGAMDANDAVDALTATINSFNKSALTSSEIVNKLANVDASFAVSSGDLAEALKRVGSTAQDTGVSFEKMVGLITAAKQITQRDGSVIGNSFKTILQRVRNPEILEFLDQFNIKIFENNGNIKDSYSLLEDLAINYQNLNPLLQDFVIQLGAGVYQSNQMRAIMNDLADANGVAAQAIRKAGEESDVANDRMAQLNLTLADLINRLRENLREAGSKIGQESFANPLKAGLQNVNEVLREFNNLSNDSTTGKILGNVLEGLGTFLTGPGLAAAGAIVGKLLYDAAMFTKDALASFTGMNRQLQQQVQLQQLSVALISREPKILQAVLNSKLNIAQVERLTLDLVKQRVAAESSMSGVASGVAASLSERGVRINSKGNIKGANPAFSPILDAINRERSAGVPMASIRVGRHPDLVNSLNPRGVGVYNLKDEPLGLGQGIRRAKTLGLNPQTHGIPNFASDKPYGLNIPGGDSAPIQKMFAEHKQLIFEEIRTRKLNLKNLDEVNAVAKKLAQTFNADAQTLRRLTQSFTYAYNVRPGDLPTAAQAGSARPRPDNTFGFSEMPFYYLSQRKLLTGGSKYTLPTAQDYLTREPRLNNLVYSEYMANNVQARQRQNTYFMGRDFKRALSHKDYTSFDNSVIQNLASAMSPLTLTHEPQGGNRTGVMAPPKSSFTPLPLSHPVMQLQNPRGHSPYPLAAVNAQDYQAQARAALWAELQLSQRKGSQFSGWNERLNAAGIGGSLAPEHPFFLPNGFKVKNPPAAIQNRTLRDRFRGVGRSLRGGALPAAILAPMAAAHFSDLIDQDTKQGRYKAAAIAGLGDIGGYGLTGFSFASRGGPKAMAIGTGIGVAIGATSAGKRLLDVYSGEEDKENEVNVLRRISTRDGRLTVPGRRDLRAAFKMTPEVDAYAQFKSGLVSDYIASRQNSIKHDSEFRLTQSLLNNMIAEGDVANASEIEGLNIRFAARMQDFDTSNILNLSRSENRPFELQRKQTNIDLNRNALETAHNLDLLGKNLDYELLKTENESNLVRGDNRQELSRALRTFGDEELEKLINSPVKAFGTSKEFSKSLSKFRGGLQSIDPLISTGKYEEALKAFDKFSDQFLEKPGTSETELIKDIRDQLIEQRLNILKTIENEKAIAQETEKKKDLIKYEYTKHFEAVEEESRLREESLLKLEAALKEELDYNHGGRQREDLLNKQMFSSDYGSQMVGFRNRRIIGELPGGFNPIKDTGASFVDSLRYDTQDLYKDLNEGAYEVGENLKSSFKGAFKEFATGASNAKEALRNFGLGVLNNIFDRVLDSSFDSFSGAIVNGASALGRSFSSGRYARGGIVRGYSKGGPVVGGSGVKDDVPAMLSAGEYVIKKSAVQKYGKDALMKLNQNTFDYNHPTHPTGGSLNVSSDLSNFALSDENNPQNALRMEREEALFSYINDRNVYNANKRQALKAFERGKKQRLYSAYLSAAMGVAGAGIGQYANSVPSTAQAYGSRFQASVPQRGSFVIPRSGAGLGRANGGFIRGFAAGGPTGKDNIPAMLMGGEFVMKRSAVNRYGVDFFNRINSGQLPKFANGGIVGNGMSQTTSSNSTDKLNESLLRLITSTESLKETLEQKIGNGNKNSSKESGLTPTAAPQIYTTINVQISEKGEVKSSTTTKTGDEKNPAHKEAGEKLGRQIDAAVIQVMIDQSKPGGFLHQTFQTKR